MMVVGSKVRGDLGYNLQVALISHHYFNFNPGLLALKTLEKRQLWSSEMPLGARYSDAQFPRAELQASSSFPALEPIPASSPR